MRFLKNLSISILILTSFYSQAQNALDFDGSNDFVQTTYTGILGASTRTIEAWIKTPYISGQEVITDWGSAVTGGRFTFALIDGKLRVEVQGSGFTSTTLIGDNTWHHVAVTFNNSLSTKYKIYIDGVLNSSFNLVTPINTVGGINMRIGVRVDGAKFFSGKIDEVRIWNVERTASQILSNKNIEFCNAPTGLIAYYKFNQGTAGGSNSGITTLVDYSGNSNNGTLTNFALSGNTSNWVSGASLTQGTGTSSSFSVTACDSYTSPSGNYTWTSSGIYIDTIPNYAGCDSIMTINVTINNSSTHSFSETACFMYTSPSGKHWYASNTYMDTIPNSVGCDSVITIILTINTVDISVIKSGIKLTSNESGATYQWIDCNNGNTPISGATNQVFIASSNGSYAVIITKNSCIDTSICFQITEVGFHSLKNQKNTSLFPNPSDDFVNINIGEKIEYLFIEIINISGSTIFTKHFANTQNAKIDVSQYISGVYFVKVTTQEEISILRLYIK